MGDFLGAGDAVRMNVGIGKPDASMGASRKAGGGGGGEFGSPASPSSGTGKSAASTCSTTTSSPKPRLLTVDASSLHSIDSAASEAQLQFLEVHAGTLPAQPFRFITNQTVSIVGACMAGGQVKSGVDQGPMALRDSGLLETISAEGWTAVDFGNCREDGVAPSSGPIETANKGSAEIFYDSSLIPIMKPLERKPAYYSPELITNCLKVAAGLEGLFDKVLAAAMSNSLVLTLGGDHSIAFASIGAMLTRYPDLCVLWIDAHSDCNTPATSPSHNYHGMPAAHLMGWFEMEAPGFEWVHGKLKQRLREDSLAYVGLRDLDLVEKKLLRNSNVHAFTMQHLDRWGVAKVICQALTMLDPQCNRPLHISLDIDSCDPSIAPGTGTISRGGLSYREVHYILEAAAATGRLVSMDLVEINPALDIIDEDHLHGDLATTTSKPIGRTVRLGIECVRSALGSVIL